MNLFDLLKQQVAKRTPLEDYFDFLKPKSMTPDEIMGQLDTANRSRIMANPQPQMSPIAPPALDQFAPSTPQQDLRSFTSAAGNQYQIPANPEYDQMDVRRLLEQYFPLDQVENALKVIQSESGGEWWKIGDDYIIPGDISEQQGSPIPSYGLFQIRGFPGRPDKETLMNPEENIKYAADLYKRRGWQPWQNTAGSLGLIE